jgi:putative ABC transport system permease protein
MKRLQKLLSFKDPIGPGSLLPREPGKQKDQNIINIIGLIKDFNFNSLRQTVTPMALFSQEEHGAIAVRMTTDNIPHLNFPG